MVVPVDHHQCSHFMPHFNCFQLPVMSSLSTFPCQIKERQYFLPMKIIIRCNQIISQSAFWHEKQHEVVWSFKVIKHFFPVLNHLSASFWTLSSFANHLLKTREFNLSAVHWSWLCRSFVQRENYLHITSFCSHAHVSRSHVSPFSHSVDLWLRSDLPGGLCVSTGFMSMGAPRSRTHFASLKLLGLCRFSWQSDWDHWFWCPFHSHCSPSPTPPSVSNKFGQQWF